MGFYTMFFGILAMANSFQLQGILTNFAFLQNYFGRGVFNVYIGSMLMIRSNDKESPIFQYLFFSTGTAYFISGFLLLIWVAQQKCSTAYSNYNKTKHDKGHDEAIGFGGEDWEIPHWENAGKTPQWVVPQWEITGDDQQNDVMENILRCMPSDKINSEGDSTFQIHNNDGVIEKKSNSKNWAKKKFDEHFCKPRKQNF